MAYENWRNLDATQSFDIPLSGGHQLNVETYFTGTDGSAEALRSRFTDGFEVEPHFHTGAQFQVLLTGQLAFPTETMTAPAIHYTDHHVAYGPFVTGAGAEFLVLHAKPAGAVLLDSAARFKEIRKDGREIVACAADCLWEPLSMTGARRKTLIDAACGPSAYFDEYPAGTSFDVAKAPYGGFVVVYAGSLELSDQVLCDRGVLFVEPGRGVPGLQAGRDGVTMIVVAFDQDAAESYGGSNFDALRIVAGDRARSTGRDNGAH